MVNFQIIPNQDFKFIILNLSILRLLYLNLKFKSNLYFREFKMILFKFKFLDLIYEYAKYV